MLGDKNRAYVKMINRYTRENTQEYKDKGKEEHTIFRPKKKKDCLNQG
jgi:hypothetical protein